MGYDIYAYAKSGDEERNKVRMLDDGDYDEIAYLRASMGAFRRLTEEGYDWFELIDASECDGGVSGDGTHKLIKLENLKIALETLEKIEQDIDNETEFARRQPYLKGFMKKCINWCKDNNEKEIDIYFA